MDSIINYLQSTMLIERLAGVSVYVLTLGYFYNKIQHARSSEAISRYLDHYLIVLCIMAFFYIPGQSADLFRLRQIAESWKSKSFSFVWNHRIINSTTPLGALLIYACQVTGINGLLPLVCAFGFYGNIFHNLKCEAKFNLKNSDALAVTFLFFMSSGVFLEVISGVRCMLAFSFVLRGLYDEMYNNKGLIKNIPVYIIAVLLHNAAIPLVGIRFFVCCLKGKKMRF